MLLYRHSRFSMRNLCFPRQRWASVIIVCCLLLSGCGLGVKRSVKVPQLLSPLAEANTDQLIADINSLAAVRSIHGRVDVQFLDTSFSKCGIAEKYSTADGDVVLQRPEDIYLVIQVPIVGTKVAEMTSDGEHFRVAVLLGDEKYRRFVRGTNTASYQKLQSGSDAYQKMENDGGKGGCGKDGKRMNPNAEQHAVSALSGLRPHHLTDALLIQPAAQTGSDSNLIYTRSETFIEEPDPHPGAKRGARVVHGYYVLDEIAPQGPGRARLMRRFWFDRYNEGHPHEVRLARLQFFDESGELITDVIYKDQKNFGEGGRYVLPATVELTRPQDHYSVRVTYQSPETVKINQPYDPGIFVLQNKAQLPEVDLDTRNKTVSGHHR